MKLRLIGVFLFAVMLMTYGCGSDSSSSSANGINGTWAIDIEKTIDSSDEIKAQLAGEPMAKEMLKNMLGDSFIVIDTEKGVMSGKMVGVDFPESKFTVVSEDGNTIKIKDDSNQEISVNIIDDNTISVSDPSGIEMVLVRK